MYCQSLGQASFVFDSGDFVSAEALEVRGEELDIEETVPDSAQVFDEVDQGNLAAVCASTEHALTGKKPAEAHAVDTTGQFTVHFHFDTVGKAQLMELTVDLDQLRTDPGLFAAGGRGGALDHHFAKSRVVAHCESPATNTPGQ